MYNIKSFFSHNTMTRTYIGDLGTKTTLPAQAGETVQIKGWIDVRRDQGKMVFLTFVI